MIPTNLTKEFIGDSEENESQERRHHGHRKHHLNPSKEEVSYYISI